MRNLIIEKILQNGVQIGDVTYLSTNINPQHLETLKNNGYMVIDIDIMQEPITNEYNYGMYDADEANWLELVDSRLCPLASDGRILYMVKKLGNDALDQ